MENENKDLQNGTTETDMQEKVKQDISEKISSAAAEVQDEIDAAAGIVNDAEAEFEAETAEAEEVYELVDDDGSWEDENFIEPVKEPKKVTMNMSSLVASWIGSAIAGALILLLCLQIPGWIANRPEGKTAIAVDGTKVTDLDMTYYIYAAAMDYFQENGGTVEAPTQYDWSTAVEDGKTAADVVKEDAIDDAIGEAILMNVGLKNGVEWDESEEMESANMQVKQMVNTFGEELVDLNAKAQGLTNTKQYGRKILQAKLLSAVQTDMEENADKYYPEDRSVLAQYAPNDAATVKHILISTTEAAPTEGEDAAPTEDKRAKAEQVLARAQAGEDFDALIAEFNDDTAEPETGYTFGPGEMAAEFEKASFALGIDEISGIVETEHGYHIIKRIAGQNELEGYLKAQAKIKTKNGVMDKLNLTDILNQVEASAEEFQAKYAEYQQNAR